MKLQTATDKKLIAMFTENTGRHMLDSGGAYGRNWERNQKLGNSLRVWNSRPDVIVSGDSDGVELTIDAYKFLRSHLSYDSDCRKLNAKLKRFASKADQKCKSWPETLQEFCDSIGASISGGENTYNGDCLLSQTLQYWVVEFDDLPGEYVILQVHGGCDVRGGYTDPVIFSLDNEGGMYRYNDVYCKVAPKVQYDPAQTELIDGLPRDNGRELYTDDGYHWYNNGACVSDYKPEFSFDSETGKAYCDGVECEFYL